MNNNHYDAIIVGGGIAGLTSTVYLARQGHKVLLIEKNRELGGLVNSYLRNGFHFDAGVRALINAGIILPMLEDLGIKLETVKSPVSLGIENEILHIKNLDSLTEYKDLLKRFYPDSSKDIDLLIKTIRRIMKHMDVLYGIENPVFKDLKRDRAFIFRKLLPWFPRFLFTVGKINRMKIPVDDYLKTIVKDPSLRDIISQHFFRNTPTFFALSYFSLYLDYFYPRDGVGRLADVIKDKIIEHGGEIKAGTSVAAFLPGKKMVMDDKNTAYTYDRLIWAADLKTMYRMADKDHLSPQAINSLEKTKAKMLKYKGGESVFTLNLQVDEPLESFEKIANGHFFYTPSKQGLGETHRSELQEILNNFNTKTKEQILEWLERFISLNTFEISIPGLKNNALAPPGKTGVIISFLAEYDLFDKIQQAGWIEEFVSEIEKKTLRVLSESVFPMLKDKVIGKFSVSPLSIHKRIASSEGAIVGWEFQTEMPVINKIQIADRSVLTPLPSVYQAGQWAYSPAGVPMSILTGKLAADRVNADLSKRARQSR